jgi:hypothetical protein
MLMPTITYARAKLLRHELGERRRRARLIGLASRRMEFSQAGVSHFHWDTQSGGHGR